MLTEVLWSTDLRLDKTHQDYPYRENWLRSASLVKDNQDFTMIRLIDSWTDARVYISEYDAMGLIAALQAHFGLGDTDPEFDPTIRVDTQQPSV